MKLIRELLEAQDNPYQPGTYINTRWIGCRKLHPHLKDGERGELPAYTQIQITDSEPYYKSDPTGLWVVYFKLQNGDEYKGLYSSEDFETSFFRGTKREYDRSFIMGLKDNE